MPEILTEEELANLISDAEDDGNDLLMRLITGYRELQAAVLLVAHEDSENCCMWGGPQLVGDFPYADCTAETCIWVAHQRDKSVNEAAERIADIITEHLETMSPDERKQRLDSFEAALQQQRKES